MSQLDPRASARRDLELVMLYLACKQRRGTATHEQERFTWVGFTVVQLDRGRWDCWRLV